LPVPFAEKANNPNFCANVRPTTPLLTTYWYCLLPMKTLGKLRGLRGVTSSKQYQ
jgi:hypothetical protein